MSKNDPKKPSAVDVAVSEKLKLARKEMGLTQHELATEVKRTFQQIQKYESGKNRISAGVLYDMAQVLKKPVAWFFGDMPQVKTGEKTESELVYEECQSLLRSLRETPSLSTVREFLKMAVRDKCS